MAQQSSLEAGNKLKRRDTTTCCIHRGTEGSGDEGESKPCYSDANLVGDIIQNGSKTVELIYKFETGFIASGCGLQWRDNERHVDPISAVMKETSF